MCCMNSEDVLECRVMCVLSVYVLSLICVVSGKELMNCKLSGNSLLIRVIAKVCHVFYLLYSL